MRICLVSQQYPPETASGGIGSQTYAKAHGLADLGHEVCVIAAGSQCEKHEYTDRKVQVIRIPSFHERMPIHTQPVEWLTYSSEVAAAVSALHSEKALDLVEFPDWGSEGYVHLLNQTEWNHIPTVIHLHGPLVMFAHTMGWPALDSEFYRVGTMMEGTCLRLADAIFSSSECSLNWCERNYDLKGKRIPILHTGVDTSHFYPRPVPKENRPTIVFVGRIDRHKGAVLLVEAACLLAKQYPDLRLRMFGTPDASVLMELREMVSAAGLVDLLEFPGFVDRQELPAHLSQCHVFAAPSIYEGGPGLVYLEAMACGLPVVACEGSGASEAIHHEVDGLLIPPGDVQALVQALDRLLSNTGYRQTMGAQGCRRVQAEANSVMCLSRIEAFYTQVAAQKKCEDEVKA